MVELSLRLAILPTAHRKPGSAIGGKLLKSGVGGASSHAGCIDFNGDRTNLPNLRKYTLSEIDSNDRTTVHVDYQARAALFR